MRKKILFFLFFIFFIDTALAEIITAPAGYSIYKPDNWSWGYDKDGALVLKAPVKDKQVIVVVWVEDSIESLDQLMERFLLLDVSDDRDNVVSIAVNGVKGFGLLGTYTQDSTDFKSKQIALSYRDKTFGIKAFAPEDDFNKYLDTFNLIIHSFKISGAPLVYSRLYAYDINVDLSIDENGNRVMEKKVNTSVIGESAWVEDYTGVPPMNFRAWDSEGPLRVAIDEGEGLIKIYYSREVGQSEYYSFTYQAEYSVPEGVWDSLKHISSNTFEYIYGYSNYTIYVLRGKDIAFDPGAYYWDQIPARHRMTIRLPSNANLLDASGKGVKRKGTDISFRTFSVEVGFYDELNSPVYYIIRYSLPSLASTPSITEPAPTPAPTSTYTRPTPSTPSVTEPAPTPTPTSKPMISLHAEKTDVTVGEPIITELSAINIQTKPVMKIQTIITPPSGMSVTSSEFVTSIAGQANAQFEVKPGYQRSIIVTLQPNQEGDFDLTGTAVYYFGTDKLTEETRDLLVPVKVRAKGETRGTEPQAEAPKTPGFVIALAVFSMLTVARLLSRGR